MAAAASQPRAGVQRTAAIAILLLAAAGVSIAGWLMMFGTFMVYDDEGYVLFSLKNFAEHGGLYREVYSQYGPLPYALYSVLHWLGLPFTHTAGRLVTLGCWTGSALLCAITVWRGTRSVSAALLTLSAVFVFLWPMIKEPTHPGGVAALILAATAAIGFQAIQRGDVARWAVATGAGVAGLALTKINVGVFAGASFAAFVLLHAAQPALRRWAPWTLAAGFALLPFALMRPLLGTSWIFTYAVTFAVGAVAVFGAAAQARDAQPGTGLGARVIGLGALAGVVAVALVLAIVMPRGTSLGDLIEGVLLGPLRHPATFTLTFPWPAGVPAAAAASLVILAAALLARRRFPARVDLGIVVLRLLALAGTAAAVAKFPAISPHTWVFQWGAPWLWVCVWRLEKEDGAMVNARVWLALLALGQWLHAYPVPGSQIAWGTFLALPLVAIGAWHAALWLRERFSAQLRTKSVALLGSLALAACAVFTILPMALIGRDHHRLSRPLGLRGAEALQLPDKFAATYRVLAANAAAHADVLFSLPGMFSFNLFTGLPAPTLANTTHWFSLLDETRQRAIVRELEAHPRACIIVQAEHVDFLRKNALAPRGVLYDHVTATFEPAFKLDDFEFHVRKGRPILPFFIAEVLQLGSGTGEPNPLNTLIRLPVAFDASRQITQLEIAMADDRTNAPLVLNRATARVEVTPIDRQGTAIGPVRPAGFPLNVSEPLMLSIYFDRKGANFSLKETLISVREADGREIGIARLRL